MDQSTLSNLFHGPLKIAVVGNGESGKSTLCRMIAEETELRYVGSTSKYAEPWVKVWLSKTQPRHVVRDAMDNRWDYREMWSEAIREYNEFDPVRLYREVAMENDLIDGIRKLDELTACYEAGIVNRCIWVRKRHLKSADSSLDFDLFDAMKLFDFPRFRVVRNDTTCKEDLLAKGLAAVEAMKPPVTIKHESDRR